MKNLLLCAVGACLIGGCAATPGVASKDEPNEMPEYTTGSIIAQKSKSRPKNVQTMSGEKLGEIQQNSSLPMR